MNARARDRKRQRGPENYFARARTRKHNENVRGKSGAAARRGGGGGLWRFFLSRCHHVRNFRLVTRRRRRRRGTPRRLNPQLHSEKAAKLVRSFQMRRPDDILYWNRREQSQEVSASSAQSCAGNPDKRAQLEVRESQKPWRQTFEGTCAHHRVGHYRSLCSPEVNVDEVHWHRSDQPCCQATRGAQLSSGAATSTSKDKSAGRRKGLLDIFTLRRRKQIAFEVVGGE